MTFYHIFLPTLVYIKSWYLVSLHTKYVCVFVVNHLKGVSFPEPLIIICKCHNTLPLVLKQISSNNKKILYNHNTITTFRISSVSMIVLCNIKLCSSAPVFLIMSLCRVAFFCSNEGQLQIMPSMQLSCISFSFHQNSFSTCVRLCGTDILESRPNVLYC